MATEGLKNPRDKYPKPPYRRQSQPWPGLAGKMDPPPDHGERQAYDPSPELYDYAQTKAATMNYVKSLAKQLGPRGIRVNGVAPGPIWTPLQVSGGASMEKLEQFGSHTPLGRPGQPAELGSIYVQLAAEDGSFATGQIYGSAGGPRQP
jgi:NAD(P)-dependent dehydrogenase (short-subunit alcohol dehydrogenase family)